MTIRALALHLLSILVLVRPCSAGSGAAASVAAPASERGVLKIGYLSSGSDLERPRPALEGLRARLLAEGSPARAALAEAGFGDVYLRPCDGPADMEQRLQAGEFQLAFATALIYARQFRPAPGEPERFQDARYEPILQFRDVAGDIAPAGGGMGVFRQGVVFIGPGSALWGVAEPTPEQIRAELERERLAVPDAWSAAGYVYPRLEIFKRFPGVRPGGPLFCKGNDQAVKHVVAGLASVGACEERALHRLLGPAEPPKGQPRLYRELFRTSIVPTDPILVSAELLPRGAGPALGRELRESIQSYFNAPDSPAPGLRVERAERRAFEEMARLLRELDRAEGALRGEPGRREP